MWHWGFCTEVLSFILQDPTSTDYITSESDNHGPPCFPAHTCQPTGLATQPPPLTRTNSESSVAVYAHMSPPVSMQQNACPVSGLSMCQSQKRVNIPSSLATHSVQHTVTPPLLTNSIPSPHPPTQTWQRTGSIPIAYTPYTQWRVYIIVCFHKYRITLEFVLSYFITIVVQFNST